jgi:hypothetical protein
MYHLDKGIIITTLSNLPPDHHDREIMITPATYPYRKFLGETSKFSMGFPEGSRKAVPILQTFQTLLRTILAYEH